MPGEVALAVRGVVHLLAAADGDGGRYAPFLQVMEQCPVLQWQQLDVLETWLTLPLGDRRMQGWLFLHGQVAYLSHIFRLREEIATSDKLARQCEDVAALALAEVKPEVLIRIYLEGGRAFLPIRRAVPDSVCPALHGMVSQPREEVLQRKPLHAFYVHRLHVQWMMNLMPIPYSVWHTPMLPPQRKRSRSDAVSAMKSAR